MTEIPLDHVHPLERLLLGRRRFMALGGATLAGVVLGACGAGDERAAGDGAQGAATVRGTSPGVKELHTTWQYLLPPAGHFNLLATDAILGGNCPYTDLVAAPMAMCFWKERTWLPLLAEAWHFDRAKDDFVVRLAAGLEWSDGSPLTSRDVLATFWAQRALGGAVWRYIDRVEASDERTVRFHMSTPSSVVERYVLKMHLVPDATYGALARRVQEIIRSGKHLDSPEGRGVVEAINTLRPAELLASGPFAIDRASITNARLTLVKNPRGALADPVHFDRLVVYNAETVDSAPLVLARDIDFTENGFPPATERALQRQGLRIIRSPVYRGPALYMNFDRRPEFRDPRARRALAFAIDRARNGTVALGESGRAMRSMAGFPDTSVRDWLAAPDLERLTPYDHDPGAAEALLRSAGWTRQGKRWHRPDGAPAEYELRAPAEWTDWAAAVQDLAEQLTTFGIRTIPRTTPYVQHFIDIASGDFQLALAEWGSEHPHPHFAFEQALLANNIPSAAARGGRGMGFELKQHTERVGLVDLEALVRDSALGLDEAAQREHVTKLALVFNELLPIIPLWERWGNCPVLEGVRIEPLPPDDDPIYQNGLYGDNYFLLLLLDGRLRPVPTAAV